MCVCKVKVEVHFVHSIFPCSTSVTKFHRLLQSDLKRAATSNLADSMSVRFFVLYRTSNIYLVIDDVVLCAAFVFFPLRSCPSSSIDKKQETSARIMR